MAQRIPMRIYRLTQTSNNSSTAFGYGLIPLIGPWGYLQGVNADNIVFYGSTQGKSPTINDPTVVGNIFLSISNIPIGTSEGVYTFSPKNFIVKKETDTSANTERYYVEISARKFYIAPTQLSTSNPQSIPDVFEFYVNPQHLTPNYRKLITEIRTRGGWEIQHWGDALTELKVTGKTGGLQRDATKAQNPGQRTTDTTSAQTLSATQPITESTAWQRLLQLKTLYNTDHSNPNTQSLYKIGFNYYDKFFVGYFIDFIGPEADAMSPYVMDFSFTIKVEQETSLTTGQVSMIAGVPLT